MIKTYSFDIRILFKKFYCPICGQRLKIVRDDYKLTEEEKKRYYKELYPHGIPIYLDVCRVEQKFQCYNCNYQNTTDNQLIIHKKQQLLKKKILDEND